MNNSITAVTREFEIRQRLQHVHVSLLDTETGQRGFLLTLRESYLRLFENAVTALPSKLERLSALIRDDPAQALRLDELRRLLAVKLAELAETIRLAKAGQGPAALELIKTDLGCEKMAKMRAVVGQLTAENSRIMARRQADCAARARADTEGALIWVVANGAFGGLVVMLLWRLNRMAPLVTVCAWSKAIEYDGVWMSFEEYLLRRFNLSVTHGISPDEAKKFQAGKRPDPVLPPS